MGRVKLTEDQIDRLCDSNYAAGLKAGWNCGLYEDRDRFDSILKSRERSTPGRALLASNAGDD